MRIEENGHAFRLIRPDVNGAVRDQLGKLRVQVRANEAETAIEENGHAFRLIRPDVNGAVRDQLGKLRVQVRANEAETGGLRKTDMHSASFAPTRPR